ncbi:regulatory protein RecX [Thalassotalea euphylliae]|uniref:Regulatory protein RecX n=1 Tax=Thalassotalea euphylliae TaxID=1655234 RepID=A0A3E0TMB9_9GAMM|nr:regulatory protein RecX [Thalassotalea euphylliae]REL25701.1 regulatory protein RecX [Thalassotalea euphylliae]
MNKDVLHSAIGLLSRREHSTKELTQKLSKKAYSSDDIKQVIAFLLDEGYLSNIRFAESVIRNKVSRGYGWNAIRQELKLKGVNSDIYTGVLDELKVDWYTQAEQAYQKRFGHAPIEDQKDKAKRLRFLQYRGFSMDECLTALNAN